MTQPNAKQHTILIVDDTPVNLTLLTHILTSKGYSVHPEINGQRALDAASIVLPDLILLDILLPDIDGYQICQQLKNNERTRDIPVIFISTLDETMDKVKAFEVGGVDYIARPFQTKEVLMRVKTHLALRNSQKHLQKQNTRLQRKISEHKQAKEALEHRNRELLILNRVGQVLSSSLKLDNVLNTALTEIQRLLDAFSVSFWLIEPETDELLCMQAKGTGSEHLTHWRLPLGKGITGWVAQHGESVVVPDTWIDTRHFKAIDEHTGLAVRSMLSIPLRAKGKVIGVLGLVDPRVDHFTQDDLVFVEPIAAAAAIAIENARLYTTAQQEISERKRTEKTLFIQTTLLHSVAEAMTCLLVQTDFPTAIAQSLELLGFATEVDHIYMFENHPHPETQDMLMSLRFEWTKDQSEAHSDHPAFQNLPYHPRFSRWYETLRMKKVIRGPSRDFPKRERTILNAQNILSTIIVPIMIRDHFWGFIGFDMYQTEHEWKEEEESILLALAGSIGGAIARQEAEKKLITANHELKEALENLTRTQTQLIQSEKMAALGQLIAGIGHEINTPLSAIRSSIVSISTTLEQTLERLPRFFHSLPEERCKDFFALLEMALQKEVTFSAKEERKHKRALAKALREYKLDYTPKIAEMLVNIGIYEANIQFFLPLLRDPEHPHILNMIYHLAGIQESTRTIMMATDRASKVVFALKTYARDDSSGEMVTAEIVEGLETSLTLYHNHLKHGVEVIRNYEKLPPFLCYPDELNQVWTNLIQNALHAMNNKGILTIDLEKQNNYAVIAFTDNGKGISADVKDHIFEPFFTTKATGEGSGLGLDIVRKIIDKHRGDIRVESQPGKTTFRVVLPMTTAI